MNAGKGILALQGAQALFNLITDFGSRNLGGAVLDGFPQCRTGIVPETVPGGIGIQIGQ